jgi:hypothetical protein
MKTYVLTISQTFQGKHPRKGDKTLFFDKILSGEKIHTIRGNYEYWKRIVDNVKCWQRISFSSFVVRSTI